MSKKFSGNKNPAWKYISKEEFILAIKQGLMADELALKFNVSYPTIFSKVKELLGYKTLTEARQKLSQEENKNVKELEPASYSIAKNRETPER